jgi:hypothetical protein
MRNEALCRVLCHNVYCLIRCIYGLGMRTEFLAPSLQKHAANAPTDAA